jgi:hypothetical protein
MGTNIGGNPYGVESDDQEMFGKIYQWKSKRSDQPNLFQYAIPKQTIIQS